MLKKLLPAILTATALLVAPALLPKLVEAGPKFLGTGKTIQSGQAISVQVTNNTGESIQRERYPSPGSALATWGGCFG